MYVTLNDFRGLLQLLKDENIGIKVKTHTGWSREYLNIIGFIVPTMDQDRKAIGGVVLSNLSETEGIMINNIASITAFDLQRDCHKYTAQTEYLLQDNIKALVLE
jgi:hypothetical protein